MPFLTGRITNVEIVTFYSPNHNARAFCRMTPKAVQKIETVSLQYLLDLMNADPAFTYLRRWFNAKCEGSFGMTTNTTV